MPSYSASLRFSSGQEEAKKLHVLPFHDVTLWKSNFPTRVVHMKGEKHEASLPYHLTGNHNTCH